MTAPIVLASTSRYRQALLARLGLRFEVRAPRVDETPRPGETAAALAHRLALAKALAVAGALPEPASPAARAEADGIGADGRAAAGALRAGSLVIGSDQAASLGDAIIGKPGAHAAAVEQLRALSGRTAVFHTAVALVEAGSTRRWQATIDTTVRYRAYGDDEIEAYLAAEPAYDCAGSAKSESLGIALLESVDSPDPTALVGLPLIALCAMLREAGCAPLGAPARAPA